MTRILKTALLVAACAGLVTVACAGPPAGAQSEAGSDGGKGGKEAEVAAVVGGQTISIAELDAAAKINNTDVYQKLYTARRQALDGMIGEMLLEQEAKAQGISVDELTQQEIGSKIAEVTDEQVADFYNKNQARMGNQPLDQMSARIRQFLTTQNQQTAEQAYLATLKKKAGVRIALDPPRVDVQIAENDPSKGPVGAPILLVEFSEFQ